MSDLKINYYSLIQPAGHAYRDSQIASNSHYKDSIDNANDRLNGNSRRWGDASAETQISVINTIISEAKEAGLSDHDTAYVLAIARVESGFNPDAAAGTTSASGLGQFIDKTGSAYGLDDSNRWDVNEQARALVEYYLYNKSIAEKRGVGEEYIYKYHHDGANGEYGGLSLSLNRVMPYVEKYEQLVNAVGKLPTNENISKKRSIPFGGIECCRCQPDPRQRFRPLLQPPTTPNAPRRSDPKTNTYRIAWIIDPLVLDLDGDGIETVAASSGVLFDHNADGIQTTSGWVTALNLTRTSSNITLPGGTQSLTGSYTRADGSSAVLADLNLTQDTFNTQYTNNIEVPEALQDLPDLPGMGRLRSLQEAAADNYAEVARRAA